MKRKRVIIEHVIPEISDGKYYVKRTVGGGVVVSADIFADGSDSIRAFLCYKHELDDNWSEMEMNRELDDLWKARFITSRKGFYSYKIEAWVDPLKSWYDKFLRRQAAGQAEEVDIMEGIQVLEGLHESGKLGSNKQLEESIQTIKKQDFGKNQDYLLSDDFRMVVQNNPFKQFVREYDKGLRVRVDSSKGLFSTWYQLFPRSTSEKPGKHGTFKDAERLLPRIQQLGFDILYFPPIHPIGTTKRKGKNNDLTASAHDPGSPWAIGSSEGGHTSIHQSLGTMADFQHLIGKAGEMGISIALDLAYQCSPDHPWVKEHPNWFRWRPDGSVAYAENPPYKYEDVIPFDFETDDWENLWNALKGIVEFWIEKGIHIFRVAVPHTKPFAFWEWLIREVQQKHPDVIFLSAAFTTSSQTKALSKLGFTQSYTSFIWKTSRKEIESYMQELIGPEMRQYFRPSFWPNVPDVLPYQLMNGDANVFALRLLLAATLSSSYGIYGPAFEFMENKGLPNGRDEYLNSEKYEIKHWDWSHQNRLTALIAKVNKIRKENPALQSTFNLQFTNSDNDEILGFIKVNDDNSNILWCVVNFDTQHTQSAFIQVPKEALGIERRVNIRVHDLLSGESYNWFNEWNYVELNPHKYPMHIFRVEVIRQPRMDV